MASTRSGRSPRVSVGPTRASVCSRWSTTFASSGEERRRRPAAVRERNPRRPRLQRKMISKEGLRRHQLLSEAEGAVEVLIQRVPPKRVGEEEAPGVRERQRRTNASVALPLAPAAATTQASLICGLSARRRLCRAGRRLVQEHDPSEDKGFEFLLTVAAILKNCRKINRNSVY